MTKCFEQTVEITAQMAEGIRHILEDEPTCYEDCFGSKEPAISVTATFDDGCMVDVKCCGVDYEEGGYNTGWTEAVLFDASGCELTFTDVEDFFVGDWVIEHDDAEYIVHVVVEDDGGRS